MPKSFYPLILVAVTAASLSLFSPVARAAAEEEELEIRLRAEQNPPSAVPEGDPQREQPNLRCRVTVRGQSVPLAYVPGTVLPAHLYVQYTAEEQPDGALRVRAVTDEDVTEIAASLARRAKENEWPIPFIGGVRSHNLLYAEFKNLDKRIMELDFAVRGDGHLLVRPYDLGTLRVGNGQLRASSELPLSTTNTRVTPDGASVKFETYYLTKDGLTERTEAKLECFLQGE